MLDIIEEEATQEKGIWVREWIKRRNELGASGTLLKELHCEDPSEYRSCLRMSPGKFDKLLNAVGPEIQKNDIFMRDAIPAKIKLEITLTYLATGCSFRNLQQHFRVSIASISKFIPDVCDIIYNKLLEHMKVRYTK